MILHPPSIMPTSSSRDGNETLEDHETGSLGSSARGGDVGGSSTGRTPSESSYGGDTHAAKALGISEAEHHNVTCARWAFILCLMVSASVLATVIFFYADGEEQDDFDTQCVSMAHDIIDISNNNINRVLNVLQGLSVMTTSYLIQDQKDGQIIDGFVTIPDVEQHFGTARASSGALVIAYLPEVRPSELEAWNQYSEANQDWIQQSHPTVNVTDMILPHVWEYPEDRRRALNEDSTCDSLPGRMLHSEEERAERIPLEADRGPFSPVWMFSPPPLADDVAIVNFDLRGKKVFRKAVDYIAATKKPTFLDVCNQAAWFDHQDFKNILQGVIAFPVFDGYDAESSDVVGHLVAIVPWEIFFENILAEDSSPMTAVLENTCDEIFTFDIQGHHATFVAEEDIHDITFDEMAIVDSFANLESYEANAFHDGTHRRSSENEDNTCHYTIAIYPSQEMADEFQTNNPIWYALVVLGVFFLTSILFVVFDCFVRKKTQMVMNAAMRQNAIVSSLFPKSVQAKMMAEADQNHKLCKIGKAGIKHFLVADKEKGDPGPVVAGKSKPIADLFPETTIMFGDISGFTAWSSAREPSQVFVLLETIYAEFDRIAKRRRVFKVEVVGDCYVAVCGLPDPNPHHAVVMAKYANECVQEMNRLTHELVLELGPDTNDLKMRVGLHSGPVVAGVLRGEKSRFQLFGDTMNTASRMESTGVPNCVQISQETADLLIAADKKHWVVQRDDTVSAKGKGELVTYFLKQSFKNGGAGSITNSESGSKHTSLDRLCLDDSQVIESRNRIADWTAEVMGSLLKEIVLRRTAMGVKSESRSKIAELERAIDNNTTNGFTVIEEVEEIIELPDFNARATKLEAQLHGEDVSLGQEVTDELRDFVRTIASLYNDNPFHNFHHANHVTMSVVKLLSRIVAPDIDEFSNKSLHDHTYGITSDPPTRFAVLFSALIHDVDHSGVGNMQLVKEGSPLATHYKNKSVAEQNSVDMAWDLLMDPNYRHLRNAIYTTRAEFRRFRSLVVNAVMATDIMDKDLKKLRNDRWDAAFEMNVDQTSRKAVNRKATIVIEHLIQASDVAHTMQHWHIYRKWNERLFREMYCAYELGRLETDPSENWHKGELDFFDFYIIPLAKKLKECGVFGVSSDEYLAYAQSNRKEWERRGQSLVEEMIATVKDSQHARTLSNISNHRTADETVTEGSSIGSSSSNLEPRE